MHASFAVEIDPQVDENVFDLHQGFLGVKLPVNYRDSLTVAWSSKS